MTNILIVDDNKDLQGAFQIAAQDEDVEIHFCASGEEALTLLSQQENKVDVALIDLAMYPMDGTSLIELIRSNEKVMSKAEMPLAIYTAQIVDDVIRDIQRENNIEKIFYKPTDPVTLIRQVKEWLN